MKDRIRERIYIEELAEKLDTDKFGVIAKAIMGEFRLYVNLKGKRPVPELPDKGLLEKTGNHFHLVSKEKDTFEVTKDGLEEILQTQRPFEEGKYFFVDYEKVNHSTSLCNDDVLNLEAIFSFVDGDGNLACSPRDELVLVEEAFLLLFRECIIKVSSLSGGGILSAYTLFEEGKNKVKKSEIVAKFSEVKFGKVETSERISHKYYKLFEKFEFIYGDFIHPIISQQNEETSRDKKKVEGVKLYQFILSENEEGFISPSLHDRIKLCVIRKTTPN